MCIDTMTIREGLLVPCINSDSLHKWLQTYLELDVPRTPVCPGHAAPFDYLIRTYFEPGDDLVVWAPRGGGKTKLGAVATLLDLLHKPGAQIRILGGSLEQSEKMWEHLLPVIDRYAGSLGMERTPRGRRLGLGNGSGCAILTQSQRSVRGLRVQKLRCDEVELFDPAVWDAAQLVTKSKHFPSPDSDFLMAGAVEAISTLHNPFGLMTRVVDAAEKRGAKLLKWCLLEVLEPCPPERDCKSCPLWDDCRGAAKRKESGFVSIDDAIAMKRRVSLETWEAEMLCRKPSVRDCVFPAFDPALHVAEDMPGGAHGGTLALSLDFGFAAPFVCLWIRRDDAGRVHVIDEYVQPGRTIHEHLAHIEQRPWRTRWVACDPAGSGHSDQTATSNVQYLRSRGYAVKHRKSLIQEGLEMIRHALRPALGPVRLYIHPRCRHLISALRAYHYAPGGSELPVKDGEHDHLIDALRYYFVNAGSLKPMQTSRRY